MNADEWQQWLISPRLGHWPTRVRELFPGEVAVATMSIENDIRTPHPLDATGFLSPERLQFLLDGLAILNSPRWLVAYWGGWSGIARAVGRSFRGTSFSLELPLRDHIAVIATLDEVRMFSRLERPYLGPGVLVNVDRQALVLSDVDSTTTYAGFSSVESRDEMLDLFERNAAGGIARCAADTKLSTALL